MPTVAGYLDFTERPSASHLTKIVQVTARSGVVLGEMCWRSSWRRYVFVPAQGTVFDSTCLQNLTTYLDLMMQEYREKRRQPAEGLEAEA